MIVLNFTRFHAWKLIFIWITQERLDLHLVQILVTESQSVQNHVISEKEESHLGCSFAKKLLTCWWIFLSIFSQESMTKTYNLFGR